MADPVRIIWKKWVDPLLAAVKEHREKGWHDGYEYLERPGQVGAYNGPCLYSGLGIIPLNELNCPSKNCNIWVGHASFDIDAPTKARIVAVPGVEMFRLWTRYRFWIGVGICFEEETVKAAVRAAAIPPVVKKIKEGPLGTTATVLALSRDLAGKHKCWAIFQLPNGKFDSVYGEERVQVEAAMSYLESKEKVVRLATSWEKETDVA